MRPRRWLRSTSSTIEPTTQMSHAVDGAMSASDIMSSWSIQADEVADLLEVDRENGLTEEIASERLARIGPNSLPRQDGPSLLRRFVSQFSDPLVGLLLVAIVVSLFAWWSRDGSGLPVEAIVIAAIVLANAVIGLWQEGKAVKAVEALRRLTSAKSSVVRDGRIASVATGSLVPGDIVVLAEGDIVGFDGRLVEAASLDVDEASLTGESVAVAKSTAALGEDVEVADRVNMVMSGTSVVRGRGRAIVVATGLRTEVGRIATLLDEAADEPTPLQRQVARLGRTLGFAVIALAGVVVASIFITSEVDTREEAFDALLVAVSLAVAAVPEGLPAIMTVVLALGVQRMSRRHAIVKRLLSVETLGSASVICTDKTGTLTRNEMTVVAVAVPTGIASVTGVGYRPDGELERATGVERGDVEQMLSAAAAASDATLTHTDEDWFVTGDPTEIALVVAATKVCGTRGRSAAPIRIDEIPFDSERKLMSVLVRWSDETLDPVFRSDGGFVQFTKGAPDVLLDRCVSERSVGASHRLDEAGRDRIQGDVAAFALTGLRTMAVAAKIYRDRPAPFDPSMEADLEWLGVVGISDPPRAEAADVIARARQAGIRTVMITGDHPHTAAAIGSSVGLERVAAVVTGADLATIEWSDPVAVDSVTGSTDVFARVAPEHKLRLVEAFQRRGHIVAMTGDGVNDAPALRQADIGVAMGGIGTDVSREAADMVLTDDDFATIVTAIEEGRNIFADIRKFLRYLLASNAGEVLVMVIGVLAAGALGLRVDDGLAVPLLATQILWINLVTDSALALALGVDPSVEEVMAQQPRRLSDPIVDGPMWVTIAVVGITTAIAGLVALDLELVGGLLGGDGDLATARTMLFTTVVLAQIFNAFNARSDRVSAFVKVFENRLLWAAAGGTMLLQVAVVHLGFLNRAFETVPLTLDRWMICWALASTVLAADEVRKWAARRTWNRLSR
jgi:Ca2+-transporting ATPase